MKILEIKSIRRLRLLREEICFNELKKLILGICEYADITTVSDCEAENKIREVTNAYSSAVQEFISNNKITSSEKNNLIIQFIKSFKSNLEAKSNSSCNYFMFNDLYYSENIKFLFEVLKALPEFLTHDGMLQYDSIKAIYPAVEETLNRISSFIYDYDDKFDFFKHILSFKGIFLPYDEENI